MALGSPTNADIVRATHKYLNTALAIISTKHITNNTLITHKRTAPNSNIEQQIRFHSTKWKREQKARVSKPCEEELLKSCLDLKKVEIQVNGFCMLETDNQYGDSKKWIQCDTCCIWFHQSRKQAIMVTEKFYHKFCLPVQEVAMYRVFSLS